MQKGDKVTVKRGPLCGMTVTLVRHDSSNRAWYAVTVNNKDKVLVYDFELAETIERKGRVRHEKGV